MALDQDRALAGLSLELRAPWSAARGTGSARSAAHGLRPVPGPWWTPLARGFPNTSESEAPTRRRVLKHDIRKRTKDEIVEESDEREGILSETPPAESMSPEAGSAIGRGPGPPRRDPSRPSTTRTAGSGRKRSSRPIDGGRDARSKTRADPLRESVVLELVSWLDDLERAVESANGAAPPLHGPRGFPWWSRRVVRPWSGSA